jgi:hypothetical protein
MRTSPRLREESWRQDAPLRREELTKQVWGLSRLFRELLKQLHLSSKLSFVVRSFGTGE